MRLLKAIYRLLSSRVLMVWLLSGFVLYYLTTAVWFGEAFGRYIVLISSNNLARIIYCLFLLNVSLILLNKLWLIRRHYISFLLRMPLYLGIILFLLSSFLSTNLRQTRWILIGEGDMINLPWDDISYRLLRIGSAIERDVIKRSDSPVFDYEPYALLFDDKGQTHRVGAFPARKINNTYMHILNFGIAPVIELKEGMRVIASGPVALRLIPFGRVDSFELKGLNYTIYLKIMPNSIIKKRGKIARKYYYIERPQYHIQISKGDKTIFEGISGDEIRFDEKTMRFYRPIPWIQLELVHDPVYPLFIISLLMTILGLFIYPFSLLRPKK